MEANNIQDNNTQDNNTQDNSIRVKNTQEQKSDDTLTTPLPEAGSETSPVEKKVKKNKQNNYNNETQPLSLLQALLLIIILAVPILNIIFVLRWSFAKGINRNKKNIARAFLIIAVFSFVFYYLGQGALGSL